MLYYSSFYLNLLFFSFLFSEHKINKFQTVNICPYKVSKITEQHSIILC